MEPAVKAITLHQPWASLIAVGVKTIETRGRRTSYRGRIVIHAGQARPVDVMPWILRPDRNVMVDSRVPHVSPEIPLRLGAVVASAVLTDCVPVQNLINEPTCHIAEPWGAGHYIVDLVEQRPFGDYGEGRWALLLDDIAPTTDRCPACWRTATHARDCTTCGGSGSVPVPGGGAACPGCYVATPPECRVCDDYGWCDPIPARGQQAVPWEWTPQPAVAS